MKRNHLVKSLVALVLALPVSASVYAGALEEDIFWKYEKAINAGDLEGVMALVAPEAEFDNPGRCKPNPCKGKDVIRSFIKETVMDVGGKIKTVSVKSAPNFLDARVEFTSEKVRSTGIERILGHEKWKIQDNKIAVFAFDIDKSDEQSLKYISSLRHMAAQEAARNANAPKQ